MGAKVWVSPRAFVTLFCKHEMIDGETKEEEKKTPKYYQNYKTQ